MSELKLTHCTMVLSSAENKLSKASIDRHSPPIHVSPNVGCFLLIRKSEATFRGCCCDWFHFDLRLANIPAYFSDCSSGCRGTFHWLDTILFTAIMLLYNGDLTRSRYSTCLYPCEALWRKALVCRGLLLLLRVILKTSNIGIEDIYSKNAA